MLLRARGWHPLCSHVKVMKVALKTPKLVYPTTPEPRWKKLRRFGLLLPKTPNGAGPAGLEVQVLRGPGPLGLCHPECQEPRREGPAARPPALRLCSHPMGCQSCGEHAAGSALGHVVRWTRHVEYQTRGALDTWCIRHVVRWTLVTRNLAMFVPETCATNTVM